ncbi:MAG: arabinogalactan oligomer / maltooligosaccharide transport system permease protein [Acidobacteriota bacterium]|jgi:arabinogalactan oligomer/maltooligosaccharide transport system permease protein|nr:arabinogalactan oligomer / maltooligosaccharide transport system permease protein [Acidobacteriota bacterium]
MTDTAPSHRRRFLIGLTVAALVAAFLGASLLAAARAGESRERSERRSVVTLLALAQLIDRAGGGAPAAEEGMGIGDELAALEEPEATEDSGEPVRRAVAAFAAAHPEVKAVRVVAFEGIRLEASTNPEDKAPRRLEREEKPLYDLGQKLRAAVAGNREGLEGAARAEEVAVERLPGGLLRLSAPVEQAGEVTGMVQMDADPAEVRAVFPWLPAVLAWLVPVVLFFLLSLVLGERRKLLAAASIVLLLATLLAFASWSRRALETERRTTAQTMAADVKREGERAEALLSELGLPAEPPLTPELWDANLYREPRGLIRTGGVVDEGRLGELVGADAGRLTRSVVVLALIALGLLAFVGWGWAARTGAALLQYRFAYAYTLPAMLGMIFLAIFPFFYSVILSFTNSNIYNTDQSVFENWVGLDNFVDILGDFSVVQRTAEGLVWDYQNFYWTLGFTLVWTVTNVLLGVTFGLLLALALNIKGLALRAVYRVILILPWALPTYITALVFKGMFHKQFGVINQIFQIFGAEPIAWFDRPLTSFLAVLTTNGWLSFPFMMVVSLGALQSIPADLYEAARVDGATRWQQFKAITMPSLRPALVPAIILSVIWTFNQFIVIFLVSAGEPGRSTEILVTQSYKIAFEQYRYGYAAAYAMVIFVILLAYGTWQNRMTKATEAIA